MYCKYSYCYSDVINFKINLIFLIKTFFQDKHLNILKECSGRYSVLIEIHIITGNEKLHNIYQTKIFFQIALPLLIFFTVITCAISSTQIGCDVMCVQYAIQWFLHSFQQKKYFFYKDINHNNCLDHMLIT